MKKYISKHEEEIIPDHLVLGKVTGVFGLKGEVRVYLHNRESNLFKKKRLVSLYFSDDHIEQRKMSCRAGAGKRIIGRIENITNVEQARTFIGSTICIHTQNLPHTENDEFYHFQLLGLTVTTVSGFVLGSVTEIVASTQSENSTENTEAVDVLIVENDQMKYYIPFTKEDVLEISIQTGILVPDMAEED